MTLNHGLRDLESTSWEGWGRGAPESLEQKRDEIPAEPSGDQSGNSMEEGVEVDDLLGSSDSGQILLACRK